MRPEELHKSAEMEHELRTSYKFRINVCCSSGCAHFGALKVLKAFEDAVKEFSVDKICKVARTGCIGTCSIGPAVMIEPGDYLYESMTPEMAKKIVSEHIVNGRPIKGNLYSNADFFQKQLRIVLRDAGKIDPLRMEDYIAVGGYSALAKALTTMEPAQVIAAVSASGLRGRGGAGFLTGQKWNFVAKSSTTPKYIVANLDEGDPGVFANRTLAEADPHSILEGMAIAAYAIGSEQGYIYIRSEYPLRGPDIEKGC